MGKKSIIASGFSMLASFAENIRLVSRETVFQGYFRIDRYRLRHRRFDGQWSEEISREVFVRGTAVAVLPYDPVRDEVVLIEQFRAGVYASGRNPWILEVIAGMKDPGETSEVAAARETLEESGCVARRMRKVAVFFTTASGCSEYVDMFCALTSTEGMVGNICGMAAEQEDIKVHVLPAEEAIRMLDAGEINNSCTLVALHWLARHREELRQEWGDGK